MQDMQKTWLARDYMNCIDRGGVMLNKMFRFIKQRIIEDNLRTVPIKLIPEGLVATDINGIPRVSFNVNDPRFALHCVGGRMFVDVGSLVADKEGVNEK